jgi:hypothetical protein
MWNKDGNKIERERDKVKVRASKCSLHGWALNVHGINQKLLITGFNFCLLCCFAVFLRMGKQAHFSSNTETCCM